jgi:Protein of unknown function (DUF2914)
MKQGMHTATLMKLGLFALFVTGCSRVPIAPDPSASAPASAPAPGTARAPGPATATPSPATATAPVTATAITAVAPAPAPRVEAPVRHANALRVDRLVVARGVVDREPQGADTLFASGEKRVFAFMEIANPEHAPGDVKVQFVAPDGVAQPAVDVSVGPSERWRTWAFTRHAHAPGTWKAVVRDQRGHVLASTEFDVRG